MRERRCKNDMREMKKQSMFVRGGKKGCWVEGGGRKKGVDIVWCVCKETKR